MPAEALERFLDDALGDHVPITVTPMVGGGSCEVFALDRGDARWVLRRPPQHANVSKAHDVLREFRFLDAIKDEAVRVPRPILSCADPTVFEAPFFVMERIDGLPVRATVPEPWLTAPATHPRALEELVDALAEIHAVDWQACGLGDLAHDGAFLPRQVDRWLSQLASYEGRDLPAAHRIGAWLDERLPPDQLPALCHGDYKLDNVLFAPDPPPTLLVVVDWEMASIGDPLVDLAWSLVFHPGPEGDIPLGVARPPALVVDDLSGPAALVARYAERSGRDTSAIGWYEVFSRWKLAIVLEGSHAKFQKGRSSNPLHELFGAQTDLLLDRAATIIDDRGGR